MMEQVLVAAGLSKSELTHCAFANGPGAFTGIRIAAAQAQGIALGLGIPIVAISTLATLAQACFDHHPGDSVLVALDARMQEIYWAIYHRDPDGCAILQGQEQLCGVARFPQDAVVESGAGHGWLAELRADMRIAIDHELLPDARSLLKLAHRAVNENRSCEAGQISINYLRNRVAEKARV